MLIFSILFWMQPELGDFPVYKIPHIDQVCRMELTDANVMNLHTLEGEERQLAFLERFTHVALYEQMKYGIPAGIKLAMGMLESASGGSELAIYANNYFGIKCPDGVSFISNEDGKNGMYRKRSKFRVNKTPWDSFRFHSVKMMSERYCDIWDMYGYKCSSSCFPHCSTDLGSMEKRDRIQKCITEVWKRGYATDRKYVEKIMNIVDKFKLYEL